MSHMAWRRYKLLKSFDKRTGQTQYSLSVPPHIAKILPAEIQYTCELTEDGILYRPVADSACFTPSWIEKGV